MESPSKDECETLVDHVIGMVTEADVGNDHGGLAGRLTELGIAAVGKLSGHYDDAVRDCMTEMTRFQVRCILKARTPAQADKCGKRWSK